MKTDELTDTHQLMKARKKSKEKRKDNAHEMKYWSPKCLEKISLIKPCWIVTRQRQIVSALLSNAAWQLVIAGA